MALTGEHKAGREVSLPGQMIALAGPRTRTQKPVESMQYRAYEMNGEKSRLSTAFNTVYRQTGRVPDSDITKAYRKANAGIREAYMEMTRQYYTALRLGVDENALYESLRGANMSKDDIALVRAGDWPVLLPSKEVRRQAAGGAQADPKANEHRQRLLSDLYNEALEAKFNTGRPYGPPEQIVGDPFDRVPDSPPTPPVQPRTNPLHNAVRGLPVVAR
jgi:hypothetical protein